MIVSQIAAISKNRVIGTENQLPWNIPEDLKYFRATTAGHICIMGRKTFESIGSRPLPKRLNIVITRTAGFAAPDGVIVVPTVEDAVEIARGKQPGAWPEEIFIVGGGQIYAASLALTDRIYLTEIDLIVSGDAHFPELQPAEFREVKRDSRVQNENGRELKFDFVVYERRT